MVKPRLRFLQIVNMSIGFLGIQFGWSLQLTFGSLIFVRLGAEPGQIPLLWLAGPMTGLIVQPIIGSLSDRTWGRLGRRRPYFLMGAVLSSLCLFLMPNSPALWFAAGLLWILDASFNVSMEPFRAFVADLLPEEQRTLGFAMQSLFIGLGAVIPSALPYLLSHGFKVPGDTVTYAFYAGAVAFVGTVLWTVSTTKEYPPDDLAAFERLRRETAGFRNWARELAASIRNMPDVMKQLAPMQMATWLGLFLMWFYLGPVIGHHFFHATDPKSPEWKNGEEWTGICSATYNAVCFAISPLLTLLAKRVGRRATHSVALVCGGLALLSIGFVQTKTELLVPMVGVGIAWASILAMPYVMLSNALPPERMGVYVGIFNFFIVLPEIIASLAFGPIMTYVLHDNETAAVMIGGACLLVASALTWFVREHRPTYAYA